MSCQEFLAWPAIDTQRLIIDAADAKLTVEQDKAFVDRVQDEFAIALRVELAHQGQALRRRCFVQAFARDFALDRLAVFRNQVSEPDSIVYLPLVAHGHARHVPPR